MRGYFLAIALCFLVSTMAWAQIPGKYLELGTNGHYFDSDYEITNGSANLTGSVTESSFQIRTGFFISEGVCLGLFGRRQFSRTVVPDVLFNAATKERVDYEGRSVQGLGGLYARYYFMLSDRFGGYGHGEVGLGSSLIRYNEEDSLGTVGWFTEDRTVRAAGIGVGVLYSPTPFAAFQLGVLRYARVETYDFDLGGGAFQRLTETYSGFRFQLGLTLFLNTEEWFKKSRAPQTPEW